MRAFSLTLFAVLALATGVVARPLRAQSLLTERPSDPNAVYLSAPNDGLHDATVALQAAINDVQAKTRRGIVFLPAGRYLITNTIQVWAGIRLIGYGSQRPVLVLAPGIFKSPATHHPLLHYAGERPEDPAAEPSLGNAGTFYSGLINVDLELGPDNAGATGISFHVAQHGVLSHVRINANGAFAAIDGAGNSMTDLELVGGEYGISTHQTAASWPYLLMDSTVSGQRRAAVRNSEATGTFIRDTFRDMPSVLSIDKEHPGQIYLRDSFFEAIRDVALNLPNEEQPFSLTAENVRCRSVASLTASIRLASEQTEVDRLSVGPAYRADGSPDPEAAVYRSHRVNHFGTIPASDVPRLPQQNRWRSLREFGAVGDGETDDTPALRRAIASGSPVYLPQGRYRITEPATLRADTVLIGLNPITTQIILLDNEGAFSKRNAKPTAMIVAPPASHPILSGIGLSAGGVNPAASALLWQASRGLVDDVRFLGGHGTALPNGHYRPPYNADRTGDPDPKRAWDTQPPSLLILGGGGTFRNLWTPNTYASAGLVGRNSALPTHLYLISAEHHVRNEVILDHVQHWQFFGLQTEAEKSEGSRGIPLKVTGSADLLFANAIFYRVSRTVEPAPTAVLLDRTHGVTFFNVDNRSQSPFPFESTITTPASKVNAHFFGVWTDTR